MMSHQSVMTSSLLIKILKIDKFVDSLCDIDYNSRADVFRDFISLIINHVTPGAHSALQADTEPESHAAQASEASFCIYMQ